MDAGKIREQLKDLLNNHFHEYFGHIGQEPYKSDIFNLFSEAYNANYFDIDSNPRLTGDAIRDWLEEVWIADLDTNKDTARVLMNDLLRRWDEWQYAWDKKI